MMVHGKLRTAEQWARIEDEREEMAKQAEREEQIEAIEAEENDMVTYHGYSVSSEFAEQMIHY